MDSRKALTAESERANATDLGNLGNLANEFPGFPEFPRTLLLALEAALPRDGPLPLSVVAWRIADPAMRCFLELGPVHPWQLSDAGREEACRRQQRENALLMEALHACFGWRTWLLLREELLRREIRVSGVLPPSERTAIDAQLLAQLRVDLATDTATTFDFQQTWRALAVEPAPSIAAPPRKTMLGALVDWYRLTYPDGHPPGLKLDTLAHQAAQATGRPCSTRTMRRAVNAAWKLRTES